MVQQRMSPRRTHTAVSFPPSPSGLSEQIRSHLKVVELSALGVYALFALFLYHYVTRLERIGCECAMDNTRDFIKYYALGLFGVVVVKLALLVAGADEAYRAFSVVVGPIMMVATVFYVVYVLKYINRLRREKCACSDTISRSVIYVVGIIQAIIYASLALILLASIIMMFVHSMGSSNN